MYRIHRNALPNPSFKHYIILIILVLSTFTFACRNKEEEKTANTYFDLKGFIENQTVYLNERKPKVTKTIVLNGKKEVSSTTSIDWQKELELFVQADINRPAFKNSYSTIKRSASELEYVIKNGEELNVRFLKIRMDTLQKKPYYVHALIKSENKIYRSEKYIELTFSNKNNQWQPVSYSVKGYQKLLFMDSKYFDVSAKIGL